MANGSAFRAKVEGPGSRLHTATVLLGLRTSFGLVAGAVLCALAAVQLPALPAASAQVSASSVARSPATFLRATEVLAEVNAIRHRRGMAKLTSSPSLRRAAEFHSREMGREGFFSHVSADGTSFAKRVRRFYSLDGHRRWAAGENLLWGPDDIGAGSAVAMWMKSPGHRANLRSRRWMEVGIAVVRQRRAPGVFRGRDIVIVTADFGVRE